MTDLAVPKASDAIDVFVAFVIPQQCHVATDNVDERIRRWFSK